MKTPITYYGGKQTLAPEIVKLFIDHTLYCEPFCGGAAVFFMKPKESSTVEVLNDTNQELINFYRVCQNDFVSLEKEVRISLHSRRLFTDASVIYNNPHMFSELKRAWAVWVLSVQGFASILDGSWGYDKANRTTSKKIMNKRDSFTEELAYRLQEVQLECTDALRIINSRDSSGALFYCDPPYYNSDCGHYDGYTREDMEMLLKTLTGIQGKFILSSYPSDLLKEYTYKNSWSQLTWIKNVTVNKGAGGGKKKIEVVTANFDLKSV